MVDSSKRRSLKAIGVMMASPLIPASLLVSTSHANGLNSKAGTKQIAGNEELSISVNLNGTPTMQVTNNSNSLTILRRVNPNVVVAGDKTYDLNYSLYSGAHGISAGETRTFPIVETNSSMANPKFSSRYPRKQLRLAEVNINSTDGSALNTSRAFFS